MRRWFLRIAALLAVLLVIAAGWLLWLVYLGGGDEPPPQDGDLAVPYSPVPDAENGFLPFREACLLCKRSWEMPSDAAEAEAEEEESPEAEEAMEVRQATREVEANKEVLPLLDEAIARPSFEVTPDERSALSPPQVERLQSLGSSPVPIKSAGVTRKPG